MAIWYMLVMYTPRRTKAVQKLTMTSEQKSTSSARSKILYASHSVASVSAFGDPSPKDSMYGTEKVVYIRNDMMSKSHSCFGFESGSNGNRGRLLGSKSRFFAMEATATNSSKVKTEFSSFLKGTRSSLDGFILRCPSGFDRERLARSQPRPL